MGFGFVIHHPRSRLGEIPNKTSARRVHQEGERSLAHSRGSNRACRGFLALSVIAPHNGSWQNDRLYTQTLYPSR